MLLILILSYLDNKEDYQNSSTAGKLVLIKQIYNVLEAKCIVEPL